MYTSAALATLLTYHYGIRTSETDAFQAVFATGDQEKIKRVGFSMLDMKKYLETRGIRADGFRMTVDDFEEFGAPVIALIDLGSYRHFVVVNFNGLAHFFQGVAHGSTDFVVVVERRNREVTAFDAWTVAFVAAFDVLIGHPRTLLGVDLEHRAGDVVVGEALQRLVAALLGRDGERAESITREHISTALRVLQVKLR